MARNTKQTRKKVASKASATLKKSKDPTAQSAAASALAQTPGRSTPKKPKKN